MTGISFTAIDFETANPEPFSICQIGLVHVKHGEIVHTFNQLVQPPDNYYWYNFTKIHGIDAQQTYAAPTFDEVWPSMQSYIGNQLIVAHNMAFDKNCLLNTLKYYSIEAPLFSTACTYKLFKMGLKKAAFTFDIALNHHDALSDAMACAKLYLLHLNNKK